MRSRPNMEVPNRQEQVDFVDPKRVDAIAQEIDKQNKQIDKDANAFLEVWKEETTLPEMPAVEVASANTDVEIKITEETKELELSDLEEVKEINPEESVAPDTPASELPTLVDIPAAAEGEGSGGGTGGGGSAPPPEGPRAPEREDSIEELRMKVAVFQQALNKVVEHAENWPQTDKEKKEHRKLQRWLKRGGKGEWPVSDKITAENYQEVLSDVGVSRSAASMLSAASIVSGDSPFSFISRELSNLQRQLKAAQERADRVDLSGFDLPETSAEPSESGGTELTEEPEVPEKIKRLHELWEKHGILGEEYMAVRDMQAGEQVRVEAENGEMLTGILIHVKLDGTKAAIAMPDDTLKVVLAEDLKRWNTTPEQSSAAQEQEKSGPVAEPEGTGEAELELDDGGSDDEPGEKPVEAVEAEPDLEQQESVDYEVLAKDESIYYDLAVTHEDGKVIVWLANKYDHQKAEHFVMEYGVDEDPEKLLKMAKKVLDEYDFLAHKESAELVSAALQGSRNYFNKIKERILEGKEYDKKEVQLEGIGNFTIAKVWSDKIHTYQLVLDLPGEDNPFKIGLNRERTPEHDILKRSLMDLQAMASGERLSNSQQIFLDRLATHYEMSQEQVIAELRGEQEQESGFEEVDVGDMHIVMNKDGGTYFIYPYVTRSGYKSEGFPLKAKNKKEALEELEKVKTVVQENPRLSQAQYLKLIEVTLEGSRADKERVLEEISRDEYLDKTGRSEDSVGSVELKHGWSEADDEYVIHVAAPGSKPALIMKLGKDSGAAESNAGLVKTVLEMSKNDVAGAKTVPTAKAFVEKVQEHFGWDDAQMESALSGGAAVEDEAVKADANKAMDILAGLDSADEESKDQEDFSRTEFESEEEREKFDAFVGDATNAEWEAKEREKERGKVMALQLHPLFIALGEGGMNLADFKNLLDRIHSDKLSWEAKGAKPFIAQKQAVDQALRALPESVHDAIDGAINEENARQKRVAAKLGQPGSISMKFTPQFLISNWFEAYERYLDQSDEETEKKQDIELDEAEDVEEKNEARAEESDQVERGEVRKAWDSWMESLKNTSAGMRRIVESADFSYFESALDNNDADVSEMLNNLREITRFIRTEADSKALQESVGQIDLRFGNRADAQRGFKVIIPTIGERFSRDTMKIVEQVESRFKPGTVVGIRNFGMLNPDGEVVVGAQAEVVTAR